MQGLINSVFLACVSEECFHFDAGIQDTDLLKPNWFWQDYISEMFNWQPEKQKFWKAKKNAETALCASTSLCVGNEPAIQRVNEWAVDSQKCLDSHEYTS